MVDGEFPFSDPFSIARKQVDLTSLDLSKLSLQKAYSIVLKEFGGPAPVCPGYIGEGNFVLRARVNDNREIFNCEAEISYREDTQNIHEFGRANIPHQSRFYGSFFTGDERETLDMVLSEVHPGYRTSFTNPTKLEKEQTFYVTIGQWLVVEKIEVGQLLFDPKYLMKLDWVRDGYIHFIESFKKQHPEKFQIETIELILQFFSKQFSSPNINSHKDYLLSAAYSQHLTEGHGMQGVIYPSVGTDGLGINVALKPSAVERHLAFLGASLVRVDLGPKFDGRRVTKLLHVSDTGLYHSKFRWARKS